MHFAKINVKSEDRKTGSYYEVFNAKCAYSKNMLFPSGNCWIVL